MNNKATTTRAHCQFASNQSCHLSHQDGNIAVLVQLCHKKDYDAPLDSRKEGQCTLVRLSKGTDYTTTGGGEVIWDKDEGTMANSAGDLFGDVLIKGGKGTTLIQTEIISSTTISSCIDQDYDYKLDVSICGE